MKLLLFAFFSSLIECSLVEDKKIEMSVQNEKQTQWFQRLCLLIKALLATGQLKSGQEYDFDFDHQFIETEKHDDLSTPDLNA